MSKIDPQILAHLEWLGFVRPTGLVVSAPALVRAGAILDQRDIEGQRLLRSCLVPDTDEPRISDFRTFAATVFGWRFSPKGYAGTAEAPIPPELEVSLDDSGDVLRPDFAVRDLEPQSGAPSWQLLVLVLAPNEDFDKETGGDRLDLSPHSRLERLLRKTGVSAGLLVNASALRLVSAPRGESSGWLDFRVADMAQTGGRPISAGMRLLLSEQRLLALPRHQRLAALLTDSRKFQNEVSEKLAEQVLHAMYELLRGFQAAHDSSKGALLREALAEQPDDVYRALLTVILRLVFLLYAEERDMLPEDETFLRFYSIAGLHERLREDAALFPDTMDQRYGAWAQLVSLFRMVHDGAKAAGMQLPPRHGALFDPDRFKFLEGRSGSGGRQIHQRIEPPLVPDGTIYRALEKLLVLDGERISYRALDVEQIGSVYETMMGFRLETATGRSVAIKSQKKSGAPTAVSLDALVEESGAGRAKSIQDQTGRKLTDTVKKNIAAAKTLDDIHAALLPVIDHAATPDFVPSGAMVLQPSEERRRSGSHYTPRELTQPIVETTLDPILARLRGADGKPPLPEAILDLKVCDPAMGSGAFLVEVCRYLGDALIESWHSHNVRPTIPPDEDEVIFARRLVAQQCLYGVDRNPVAVDLAKMSLWLVTLAKDHPLTFVDHALRHGDSLVGLSRRQLEAFHWEVDAPRFQAGFEAIRAGEHLAKVSDLRRKIREAAESVSDWERRDLWDEAQFELSKVRLIGDLAVAAFFEAEKPRERNAKRSEFVNAVVSGEAERYRGWLEELRLADPPMAPFHWEIEFSEVFERQTPGFDAFVGNPPYIGGTLIGARLGLAYHDYLVDIFTPATGLADLIAFFVRRSFAMLRENGTLGFIATNTVAQGDTRSTGLETVIRQGGNLYQAVRRYRWPGEAAVIASVFHIQKSAVPIGLLDGRRVPRISSFLLASHAEGAPVALSANRQKCFLGAKVWGAGFVFEREPSNGSWFLADMDRLIKEDPHNRDVIFPYIGGEEFNESPVQAPIRYVIDFARMPQEQARMWPALFAMVEERVRPIRATNKQRNYREEWWLHANRAEDVAPYLQEHGRVLALSAVSKHLAFGFVKQGTVVANSMLLICLDRYADFAVLQSRAHEVWPRVAGSSMKDDPRYTTACFDTFARPLEDSALQDVGKRYYDFRAALMIEHDEGLTETYNRFHDPEDHHSEILKLRELHAAMDRAVLDAYGWTDIETTCEFLLDYEIDEEEWGDKKKPYRYRWPDDVRDEVLARLLELNAERARDEARSGAAAEKTRGKKRRDKSAAVTPNEDDLFS